MIKSIFYLKHKPGFIGNQYHLNTLRPVSRPAYIKVMKWALGELNRKKGGETVVFLIAVEIQG
jgi:hypothetical protein